MPIKNTYEVVYEVPFTRDDALRHGVKRVDWEKHRMTVQAYTASSAENEFAGRVPSSRYKIISVTKVS